MTENQLNLMLCEVQLQALDWLQAAFIKRNIKLNKDTADYFADEQARLEKLAANLQRRIENQQEAVVQGSLFDLAPAGSEAA